ncbi:MAG: hypothetical protein IPQ02_14140 [Saprospiraceae bacterium]|nr:hypothetical protein [Candidatus Defluviibacterium haderslevense]
MKNTPTFLLFMKYFAILVVSLYLIRCNRHTTIEKTNNTVTNEITFPFKEHRSDFLNPLSTTSLDQNIRSIFQDNKGIFWFGTNGAGVYRFDGIQLNQFTEKDGLSNNQILSIQEDQFGNIWFGTGIFGVSKFNGKTFTSYTNKERLQFSKNFKKDWKIVQKDLWFYAGGGVYHYHDTSFVYLPLAETKSISDQSLTSPFVLSRFAVYSMLKDKKGNVWLGTQAQGVLRYNGKSFTWFTEKGLSGSAVLSIFEDRRGNIWFGNNGAGLFRFDGETLTNVTEEKQLTNYEFKVSGASNTNTLARIYSINEDNFGNLWIGTVDAGVWKYDGTHLTHYTLKDGLSSNAVNTIYKDKNGQLWFGTDENGICKFNGINFQKFNLP